MAPIMGFQCRVGVAEETTPGTAVAASTLLELISGDLGLAEEELHGQGLIGSRSEWSARTRANRQRIATAQPLVLAPNAAEWAVLLPWILGGTPSGTAYALAETLKAYTVVLDKDNGTNGKTFTYAGCYVSRAVIRSTAGGPVECELTVEGMTEAVGNAGTFPSLNLNVATGPFLHSDADNAGTSTITVGGTAYKFRSVEVVIDNMLDVERFLNSTTRGAIPSRGRMIEVNLEGPYGDATAAYPTAATLAAGVAVVITWTNTVHAVSLALSLPKVHFPRLTPPWVGREELMLPLRGRARASSALSDELAVTLDSTP